MHVSGLARHPPSSPGQGMDVVDRASSAFAPVEGVVPLRAVAIASGRGREHGLGAPAFGVVEASASPTPAGQRLHAVSGPVGVACASAIAAEAVKTATGAAIDA